MSSYWDSSALIDAILGKPESRTPFNVEPDKVTRCHTLAECFSHLTGGRLGKRLQPEEAASVLNQFAKKLTIISLDAKQTLDAMNETTKRGVRGGAIHDFLHAYAAELHGCEKIFTGNVSDFLPITKLEVIKA